MIRGLIKALPRPYPNYVVHGQNWSTDPTGPTHAQVPDDLRALLTGADWSRKPQIHSPIKNSTIKADIKVKQNEIHLYQPPQN